MITYLLVQFSDGTYTLIDRRISRGTGVYKDLHTLLKDLPYIRSNGGTMHHSYGTVLFKSNNLEDFMSLPDTHPEYFI